MKIYLDMDGVLADFVQHTTNLKIPNNHQWFEPRETWTKETLEGEAIKTKAMHSPGFWIGIPPMPGAEKLWHAAHSITPQVYVLTAKPQPDSPKLVDAEKYAWLYKHLDSDFSRNNFICCERHEKVQYAKGNVLVDDDPRNCKTWEEAGGTSILYGAEYNRDGYSIKAVKYPDTDAAILKLKEVFNAA